MAKSGNVSCHIAQKSLLRRASYDSSLVVRQACQKGSLAVGGKAEVARPFDKHMSLAAEIGRLETLAEESFSGLHREHCRRTQQEGCSHRSEKPAPEEHRLQAPWEPCHT